MPGLGLHVLLKSQIQGPVWGLEQVGAGGGSACFDCDVRHVRLASAGLAGCSLSAHALSSTCQYKGATARPATTHAGNVLAGRCVLRRCGCPHTWGWVHIKMGVGTHHGCTASHQHPPPHGTLCPGPPQCASLATANCCLQSHPWIVRVVLLAGSVSHGSTSPGPLHSCTCALHW